MTARLLTLNRATTSVQNVVQSAITEASLHFNSSLLKQMHIFRLWTFFPFILLFQAVKFALGPGWEGGDHRKNFMPLSDCEYADVR